MNSECHSCGWRGDANELNWMILEHNDEVGGERVCPECRNPDIALLV